MTEYGLKNVNGKKKNVQEEWEKSPFPADSIF